MALGAKKYPSRTEAIEFELTHGHFVDDPPRIPGYYMAGAGPAKPKDSVFHETTNHAFKVWSEGKEEAVEDFDVNPNYPHQTGVLLN